MPFIFDPEEEIIGGQSWRDLITPNQVPTYGAAVKRLTFGGNPTEYPITHLRAFIAIASNIKVDNISQETIYHQLFPDTLTGKAYVWYCSLPLGSTPTWADLARKFLDKYCRPKEMETGGGTGLKRRRLNTSEPTYTENRLVKALNNQSDQEEKILKMAQEMETMSIRIHQLEGVISRTASKSSFPTGVLPPQMETQIRTAASHHSSHHSSSSSSSTIPETKE